MMRSYEYGEQEMLAPRMPDIDDDPYDRHDPPPSGDHEPEADLEPVPERG